MSKKNKVDYTLLILSLLFWGSVSFLALLWFSMIDYRITGEKYPFPIMVFGAVVGGSLFTIPTYLILDEIKVEEYKDVNTKET